MENKMDIKDKGSFPFILWYTQDGLGDTILYDKVYNNANWEDLIGIVGREEIVQAAKEFLELEEDIVIPEGGKMKFYTTACELGVAKMLEQTESKDIVGISSPQAEKAAIGIKREAMSRFNNQQVEFLMDYLGSQWGNAQLIITGKLNGTVTFSTGYRQVFEPGKEVVENDYRWMVVVRENLASALEKAEKLINMPEPEVQFELFWK